MPIKKEPFKNTVIYIRTSTDKQNPLNQLANCKSIRPKDNKIDTFVDYTLIQDKESAWKEKKREGFNLIQNKIKKNKIKNLIVWDLDRLYRNRKKLIAFFKFCKLHKCLIYSYNQSWLEEINKMPEPFNEAIFDLMLQIIGWISQDESDRKSKRIKLAVRKIEGKPTKSYRGNKWGRKPTGKFKKTKIKELANEGYSIRNIAKEVKLAPSTVHKLLKEIYLEKTV